MGNVYLSSLRALKSTIGRTNRRRVRPALKVPRDGLARRALPHRMLSVLLVRVRNPIAITARLDGWTLDEEEIYADLEHGRD